MTYAASIDHWWNRVEYLAGDVLLVGFAGYVYLVMLVTVFVVLSNGIWLLWPALRPRRAAELWLSTAGCALLVALGCGAWVIVVCRRAVVLAASAESTFADGRAYEALERAVAAVELGATSVLLAVPLLCLVALVRWRGWTARALTVSCACLVLSTAWSALEQNRYVITNVGCGDPVVLIDIPHDVFVEGQGVLERSTEWVMLVAVVGLFLCVAAAARDARLGLPLSSPTARGAGAVLALGLAAFVATRPAARDARASVPHRGFFDRCPRLENAELPRARVCAPLPELPFIEILPHALAIDGSAVEPSQLGKVLQNKHWLYEQVNPGKKFSSDRVIVGAPEKAEPQALAAGLTELAQNGIRAMAIALRRERTAFSSVTLSTVRTRTACCSVEVRFDSEGVPITAYKTWNDLARAAQAGAANGQSLPLRH